MKKNLVMWVMVLSLMLASCGGRSSRPVTEVDLTMTDFQFQPTTITVPAGQEISVNASNSGAVVHSFVIMKQGQSAGSEFNEEDQPNVYWEVEIQPGGSTETSFMAPTEPGEYEFVCHVPGHVQAGMVGKLNVVVGEQD
jgi:uncharacterized cupredoxin-like copper-binding protein